MDLDRDHWGDESNGPPPGASLPPGASTSSGGIHPGHPNAVAPPGTQGNQMFGANHQGVEPAAAAVQRTSNGAPQPPPQGPPGGIGGSTVAPHIRQNGKLCILKPGSKVSADGTEYQSVHFCPKLRVLDSQSSSLEYTINSYK